MSAETVKQTEPNARIGAGKAGPGRPKGSVNKTTRAARDAIEEAAEALGGAARLTEWVREAPENERVFWGSIYTKLLPLKTEVSGDLRVATTGELTDEQLAIIAAGGR